MSNSLDLIKDTIKFEQTDRVPVIPQIFGHSAILTGHSIYELHVTDSEIQAQSQIEALNFFGGNAVFSAFDASIETEAIGSELEYHTDNYPDVNRYFLNPEDLNNQISNLKIPESPIRGKNASSIKCVENLKGKSWKETLVTGLTLGPFTLATQLYEIQNTLFLSNDEPETFMHLLDYTEKVVTEYGIAQIEAGAHLPLLFEPAGSGAVIPQKFFIEHVQPQITRILSRFKQAGAIANWLHIAGPTNNILSSLL